MRLHADGVSDFFNAFDISPVPAPGPDAVAPEPFRGIYGMPMFVTVPTPDLAGATEFWTRGLGFFELFSIPGQVVHLRRWAFQDVLLKPRTIEAASGATVTQVNFACVLNELSSIADACNTLRAGSSSTPFDTPWNTRDIEVTTPDGTRVVFTAAKPMDLDSAEVKNLAKVGIIAPEQEA